LKTVANSELGVARVRQIEIKNFRGIAALTWDPSPGINCLIGPGDSGKSTVLDAIDLCLGARRTAQFSDSDFYQLDVTKPVSISVTVGELSDALRGLDAYGLYLRGYDPILGIVEEEPSAEIETVLTINLTVAGDLEPVWSLVSARAAAQGQTRNLAWSDRVNLAPTRLGAYAGANLSWRRGSVLNLLSDEKPDASAALVKAAREARAAFGEQAAEQLVATLAIVEETASELGIPYGNELKAMLDSHSISFSGGTISLHDELGVPLRGLGIGSTRLLSAGLQRRAAENSTIVLIDELEHGLEPHRLIRLLGSIGAKEQQPPLQAFVTTHSPTALRELSALQLHVVRKEDDIRQVPSSDDIQGTIRLYPEALLAPTVLVCEGASEVGLLRGIDQYHWKNGQPSLSAMGVALVDGNGADQVFKRGQVFRSLGYRTAVLRDDDVKPTPELEDEFKKNSGKVSCWREGRTLEDELFLSLSEGASAKLLAQAVELHGEELIDANIRSASQGAHTLASCRAGISAENRVVLGKASRPKKAGWFKSVTWMETVARDIVAPDLAGCEKGFAEKLRDLFQWIADGGV
jgi:putative ATP-dependent endonuclease of OLD family